LKQAPPTPTIDCAQDRILAIGASTGGPSAVAEILAAMPKTIGPILVVQHMPAVFTSHFAARLNEECEIEVKEAVDGDEVIAGRALIAPGGFHTTLVQTASGLRVRIADGPLVCFSKPSVDVLFSSIASLAKDKVVGVILTGMGADGARGLLDMRNRGAATFAQDEDSCVVFGMPKEAIRLGAAQMILPLNQLAAAILSQVALIRSR
jgi:two-component system chemotaxis response regulator CheB